MFDASDNPILAAWRKTVDRYSTRPAILSADGTVLATFSMLEKESVELAKKLPHVGGIATVELGNHPSLPAVLIALWRAGMTVALVEPGAVANLPGITLRVAQGVRFFATDEPPLRIDAHFLKLTSGTTAAPRAVRFTAAQLLADCDAVCDTMGITDADLNYGVISWAHSYGFSNLVLPLICRGIPVVATEDRLPRAILAGLARTRATVLPAVPVFFQKLAALDAEPLPALRLCISAGAPLSTVVATEFRQRFGVKVHSFYGSSECGGVCYDASDAAVPEGCVGEPMRGVALVESEGRIQVHSPAVALGYWPQPEPEVLGEGRFIPGDLIEKSEHGITLKGRASDTINIAGRKVNPVEIESILRQHPAVRECVVFGVPSAIRGEEPVACVVADASPAELLTFAAERLPAWQTPKHIWLVESLPTSERGKHNRRTLAEQWAAR